MRRSMLLPALFGFFLLWAAPSGALTIEELKEKMTAAESGVKTLRFDYYQEMRTELSPEVRQSSGTAWVQKPKQWRIEQKAPERQLIVSSGKTIFVYTPRFEQVLKDSWSRWMSKNALFPGLVGFTGALDKLKRDYDWKLLGPGRNEATVELRPMSGQDQALKLWVDPADFLPRKTEWRSGTLTLTTRFEGLEPNPRLDSALFRFAPPKGTEVIDAP